MSAHTPGPWHAAPKSPKTWNFGVYDEGGTEVAHVAAHALNFFQRKADARLIAAAPDMLATLEQINEWCCFATEEDINARLMALQQIGVHARASIAKATESAP